MNICLQTAKELLEKGSKRCKCMYNKRTRMLYKNEHVVLFGDTVMDR